MAWSTEYNFESTGPPPSLEEVAQAVSESPSLKQALLQGQRRVGEFGARFFEETERSCPYPVQLILDALDSETFREVALRDVYPVRWPYPPIDVLQPKRMRLTFAVPTHYAHSDFWLRKDLDLKPVGDGANALCRGLGIVPDILLVESIRLTHTCATDLPFPVSVTLMSGQEPLHGRGALTITGTDSYPCHFTITGGSNACCSVPVIDNGRLSTSVETAHWGNVDIERLLGQVRATDSTSMSFNVKPDGRPDSPLGYLAAHDESGSLNGDEDGYLVSAKASGLKEELERLARAQRGNTVVSLSELWPRLRFHHSSEPKGVNAHQIVGETPASLSFSLELVVCGTPDMK